MSAHANQNHAHDDHHDHHDDGHGEITFRGYMTGFILAVILTVIPFWLVMGNVLESSGQTALIILGLGAVQMIVHIVYFLHMNPRAEGGWNMLALIFTIIVVLIALVGSLWVMYHLNTNMMPDMIHDMKNML
ncbi:cytochrome o ubiquinol oxidase subunit IV [Paracandidimonas soli]|uniref:Cytochrome bo(3) ubiquinol oxidase subunit 4 n=1 Tax=Paracandidimonas soli TaxID=1917182 RepID=A0A4V2VS22_9BURK|nr:cytochrome o ubiquinol oxidase subunit IV [Paracandidimonas soli]TCV00720.1 cytochrome bo3 quinol oxidase subunit 4 [Paracandidimonas soli]